MKKYKVVLIADSGITITLSKSFESWTTAFSSARLYLIRKGDLRIKEVNITETRDERAQEINGSKNQTTINED